MQLFHATAHSNLVSIAAHGLRAGSYWTSCASMHAYYLETVEDEGQVPATVSIDLSQLLDICRAACTELQPDLPGIAEPITTVLARREDEVWQQWYRTGRTWVDSLVVVRSLRCPVAIPAAELSGLPDLQSRPVTESGN